MEPWSPTAVSPVPALGLGHLAGPSVPQLTNGQGRVFRLSPFRPLLPTQLFTAWLAVDSWGPVGACPAGRLHPRREPGWGQGEQLGSSRTAQAPGAQRAHLHLCVSGVFVFLLHVLLPLSLLTPLPSCCPQFPAPGTPLLARSWRSRSVGPDLFATHPSEVSALPSVLLSGQADGRAPWQEGDLPQSGGGGLSAAGLRAFLSPPRHPQASQQFQSLAP